MLLKQQLLTNLKLDYLYYNTLLDSISSGFFNSSSADLNDFEIIVDNAFSVFHTSIPNVKLYYPEPFIATPTFIHDDIWFLHIVIYQYWLWFIFIYIIIFFFLVFLITLRWCNIRHKPVRETRGVSRSKCGDLITATVPISWATSIIIHESTDAIEFNGGFGSTEMALGIRAYQWGWEYYYPKDLNLTLKTSGNKYMGNSLKSDNSLGKDSNFFTFKNNYANSDFGNVTSKSNFNDLLSLNSPVTADIISKYNFGANKLIPRKATTLITSKRLLNLNESLIDMDLETVGINAFNNSFLNFSFDKNYPAKPGFINHQLTFFSSVNSFQNALSFLNTSDLSNYLRNLSGVIKNSVEFSSISPQLHLGGTEFPTNLPFNYSKLSLVRSNLSLLGSSSSLPFSLMADQDFKRWSANELLEDLSWNNRDLLNLDLVYNSESSDASRVQTSLSEDCLTENVSTSLLKNSSFRKDGISFSSIIKNTSLNYDNINYYTLLGLTSEDFVMGQKLNSFRLKKLTDIVTTSSLTANLPSTLHDKFSQNYLNTIFNYNEYSLQISLDKNGSGYSLSELADLTFFYKNFSTFYGAFWKVFKSVIEEERGSFYLNNYSNINFKLPVVGENIQSNLVSLQKNSKPVFNKFVVFQSNVKHKNLNLNFENVWSVFTFEFPFSVGFESDIIRYSWFDWYSVRNTTVTKAIDTSVFNLNGVKDYNYSFQSNNKSLEVLNRTDNFFLKYRMTRKLLIPSYTYTPYFLNKNFNNLNTFNYLSTADNHSFNLFRDSVKLFREGALLFSLNTGDNFVRPLSSTFSTTVSPSRMYLASLTSTSNNSDLVTNLFDVLTKREYIYKTLGVSNLKFKDNLSVSFRNPLVYTVRTLPSSLVSNGDSKNMYPFSNNHKKTSLEVDKLSLKSQYQPLRKGIVNMIRIQADKAIAMPTDTRIQILAVSKDIIHSWAIPSAGIKIDCIPGYSSHRVAIFTLSGIYWGQCMEICGRFHHWMPIVVYFMRRDLFCLWCVHFIFKNNQTNNTLQSYEMNTSDNAFTVSKGNTNWVYELK